MGENENNNKESNINNENNNSENSLGCSKEYTKDYTPEGICIAINEKHSTTKNKKVRYSTLNVFYEG